jgi:hypothetical protein
MKAGASDPALLTSLSTPFSVLAMKCALFWKNRVLLEYTTDHLWIGIVILYELFIFPQNP